MRNTFKLFGIIVLTAIIGFSMAACDDGPGYSGPIGTLTITGVPANLVQNVGSYGGSVGIYPAGTDAGQALLGIGQQAKATFEYAESTQTGSTYTVTVTLLTAANTTWTGSGNYRVLVVIGTSDTAGVAYGANVNFSSGSATIAFGSAEDLGPVSGGLTQDPPWSWGTYDDRLEGGHSTISITESSGTVTFTGGLNTGIEWPYAGFDAYPNEEMLELLKTAGSIRFDVYGDGRTYSFRLPTTDITDYCYYEKEFTPTANTWQTITIGVNELEQPEWGSPTSFNQNQVGWIQWGIIGNLGSFSVKIKNLTLFDSSGNASVAFSSLGQDGSSTKTTTQLTLNFSQVIDGLSANDITLSGVDGVTKGTLSGVGPSYTLPISGVTTNGTLTVSVAKSGYTISGSSKTTTIYYSPGILTITGVPQNLVQNVLNWGGDIGVYSDGEPLEWQAGILSDPTLTQTGSTYTVTVALFQGPDTPWTTSGTYLVWVDIYTSETAGVVYEANVTFTSGSATIPFTPNFAYYGTFQIEGGGGDPGNPPPSSGTLTITGVPQDLVSNVNNWGGMVGIFPAETTLEQALEGTDLQAGAEFAYATTTQTGDTYTVTVTLFIPPDFNTLWTANGSYQVYVVVNTSDTAGVVYGATAGFSQGSATLDFSSAIDHGTVDVGGDDGGGDDGGDGGNNG